MHAKGRVVISPHFDDAVMSCGELIGSCSGVVVATVCSASPGPRVPASPEWDAAEFETLMLRPCRAVRRIEER